MKKLNRFVTSFMALSVVMTSMAPSFVGMAYSAELEPIDQENPEIIEEEILDPEYSHVDRVEDEVLEEEIVEEEIAEEEVVEIDFDVDEYKDVLIQLTQEINEIQPTSEEEAQKIEEFNQSSEELFDILLAAESIENQANGISTYAVVGPDILGTIKDTIETLDSVPQRMELFVTMARAIKFSTSDIRYKGPDAQLKMTAYITTGLIKVVNTNTSVDEMKEYALKFEDIASELTALPDLADDARANMYLRVDLDQEMARVKDMYKYELEDKSTYVIDELDDAVKAARRIRMRSRSTVADIKLAFENLEAAVNKALESTDYRASQEEINQLKALRNDLRRENIRDERRDYVNNLVKEANKELGLKRPSKEIVNRLNEEIKVIMDFQEANTAPADQVEELRVLRDKLRREGIRDERRDHVNSLVRAANQELGKKRPAKDKVAELVQEIQAIMDFQEANTAPADQVEKLKDLKTQLQRARINDHRRERVLQIIRESNQEISKRRSDKEKVQALIIEIEEILQPEESFQPELVEEIA